MEAHSRFAGLWLHSNEELARLLGCEVAVRETIHEWPLSCVQRLTLPNDVRMVYKAQLPPTVECEFYRRNRSSLLPSARLLGSFDQCEVMLMDWIEGTLLKDAACGEAALREHGRRLTEQIGEIAGDSPVFLDVGSWDKWNEATELTFAKLEEMIQGARFTAFRPETVIRLRRWAGSAPVRKGITGKTGLIHGDLNGKQVFCCADRYRVIDWQRPMIAPPAVDGISLLVTGGFNPRRHFSDASVGIYWFLFLHWAVMAQADLFPEYSGAVFERWARVAAKQILHADAPPPPPDIPPR